MNDEGCPITSIYAIESGIPIIGLGILFILVGIIGFLLPGIPGTPLPAMAIFLLFGLFLIWAGLTR